MLEWLGGPLDPEEFDVAAADRMVAGISVFGPRQR